MVLLGAFGVFVAGIADKFGVRGFGVRGELAFQTLEMMFDFVGCEQLTRLGNKPGQIRGKAPIPF
ncbi:hypothetical protein CKO28_09165, partial [Rhodovibrio sodomensis]|nr:hypothetical protein [Rhodovibrio sodomensis]